MAQGAQPNMFRAEAVKHHVEGVQEGDILRYDHTWTRLAYPLVVIVCVLGFVFISVFGVDEWAQGQAIVKLEGRKIITSTQPATVASIEVKPGQWVEANTVVVKMVSTEEEKELASATKEYEYKLVQMLRDPSDQEAKVQLGSLRTRRDSAKTMYESRIIRTQTAGSVTDIRVKEGMRLNPGDVILTVAPKNELQASIVAFVPASYRPSLETGQAMRFELDGFQYNYTDLTVEEVSTSTLGPAEVQRLLGQDKAGTVAPNDPTPKVLVSAKLPATSFAMEGDQFNYADGLTGNAQIRVRREPILILLIPALRSLIPSSSPSPAPAPVSAASATP